MAIPSSAWAVVFDRIVGTSSLREGRELTVDCPCPC